MSRISRFFHEHKDILYTTVEYLETVDIPKEKKAKIASSIVQMLHLAKGGVWDNVAQQAVNFGIDWTLSEIRSWAKTYTKDTKTDPTPSTPPTVPVTGFYGVLRPLPILENSELRAQGGKPGDIIWIGNDAITQWYVLRPGELANPNSTVVRTIE